MILFLHGVKQEHRDKIQTETGETVLQLTDLTDEQAAEALREAEIMIGFATALSPERLQASSRLRWFHMLSAGVEQLEFEELKQRHVLVSNSSGIHGRQMAEQVFGMMLAFTRGLYQHWENQRQAVWNQKVPVCELFGQTLTIVGAGRIGREVARKAKAFDMHVLGVKRIPEPLEYFDEVMGVSQLSEAISQADFVLALTPLTSHTLHLIGQREFAAMKTTAVFMNYARGDVVDETAMVDALQSGKLGGLGLDVFHKEPLPAEHPLWHLKNVLITPHTSGISPTYTTRALDVFLANYHCYREGTPLVTGVNLDEQY